MKVRDVPTSHQSSPPFSYKLSIMTRDFRKLKGQGTEYVAPPVTDSSPALESDPAPRPHRHTQTARLCRLQEGLAGCGCGRSGLPSPSPHGPSSASHTAAHSHQRQDCWVWRRGNVVSVSSLPTVLSLLTADSVIGSDAPFRVSHQGLVWGSPACRHEAMRAEASQSGSSVP